MNNLRRKQISIYLLFALFMVLAAGMIFSAGCARREAKKLTVYTYASFPRPWSTGREDFQQKHGVELVFESLMIQGRFSQLIREKENPVAGWCHRLDSIYFSARQGRTFSVPTGRKRRITSRPIWFLTRNFA